MKVRLWGVRGSIPSPGPETVRYGGNTACLEVRTDNRIIIIDAGSGIRPLGDHLMAHDLPKGPLKVDLFFTHTHWDHILGFPFFTPIFVPGTEIDIYGPVSYESESLEKAIGGQLKYRYFPVRSNELAAKLRYHTLSETSWYLTNNVKITTKILNHPVSCMGYRFDTPEKSFCTLYDMEPYYNLFSFDNKTEAQPDIIEEGDKAVRDETDRIVEFMRDADLVIHDAQYTKEEYESSRRGYGHSFPEYAIDNARKAGVKHLVLFHHDIRRTDRELDLWQKEYAEQTSPRVTLAQEGMEWDL